MQRLMKPRFTTDTLSILSVLAKTQHQSRGNCNYKVTMKLLGKGRDLGKVKFGLVLLSSLQQITVFSSKLIYRFTFARLNTLLM